MILEPRTQSANYLLGSSVLVERLENSCTTAVPTASKQSLCRNSDIKSPHTAQNCFPHHTPPHPTPPHPPRRIIRRFHLDPFRTAVPFWGQTRLILSSLSPKRDCGPKRIKAVRSTKIYLPSTLPWNTVPVGTPISTSNAAYITGKSGVVLRASI